MHNLRYKCKNSKINTLLQILQIKKLQAIQTTVHQYSNVLTTYVTYEKHGSSSRRHDVPYLVRN